MEVAAEIRPDDMKTCAERPSEIRHPSVSKDCQGA